MSNHRTANNVATDNSPDYRQSYTEGSVGVAGSYRINNRTGRLDFTRELFVTDGERLPLALFLTYNPYLTDDGCPTRIPGWKLNYEQFVYAGGEALRYYVDGDFRRHKFEYIDKDDATDTRPARKIYADTDHTYLVMYEYADRTIIDDGRGTTLTFVGGKLTEIAEKRGAEASRATISRLPEGIAVDGLTVTDGMGRTAAFMGKDGVYYLSFGHRFLTLRFDSDSLTITDVTGGVCTYGYAPGDVKELASISSDAGDYADVTFDGTNRVIEIAVGFAKDGTKKVIDKYELAYGDGYTDVTKTAYPTEYNTSSKIVMRYTFTLNGEAVGSYELKDDKAAAVRFRSLDDYRRYILKIASDGYSAGSFYGFRKPPDSDAITSELPDYNLYVDFYLPETPKGEDYVLSFLCERLDYPKPDRKLYISLPSEDREIKLSEVDGAQPVIIRLANFRWEWNSIEFTINCSQAGNLRISQAALVRSPKGEDIDCLNVDTGSGFSYNEDGVYACWYELSDCRIDGGGFPVLMTGTDWRRTLENRARSPERFIVWSLDGGAARLGDGESYVKFGGDDDAVSHPLSSLRFATVSLRGTRELYEYETYGSGDEYLTVWQKTVYPDRAHSVCTSKYDEHYNLRETTDSRGTKTVYDTDDYGNVTRVTRSNGELKTVTENEYGELADGVAAANGRYLLAEKSYLKGETCAERSVYDPFTGDVTQSVSALNHPTDYVYRADRLPSEISSEVDGTENGHAFVYDRGKLAKISHNGFAYTFTYNDYGDVETVTGKRGENETVLIHKKYFNLRSGMEVETYTNINYGPGTPRTVNEYDAYGRLVYSRIGEYMDDSSAQYVYTTATDDANSENITCNADSKLRMAIDNETETLYTYTATEKVAKTAKNYADNVYEEENGYDEDDRLTKQTIFNSSDRSGSPITITYDYERGDAMNGDRVIGSRTDTTYAQYATIIATNDTYDGLDRLQSRNSHVDYVEHEGMYVTDFSYGTTYTYAAGREGETTELIESETLTFPDESTLTNVYDYDKNGNIRTVTSGGKNIRYTYDGLNRLIREDNERQNKTVTYGYDAGGNRTEKKEYGYTLSAVNGITPVMTQTYAYDSVWSDRLTSVTTNGVTEKVNGYGGDGHKGAPTTYRGATLGWSVGRLSSYEKNGILTEYRYKSDNTRDRKTVGNKETYYLYEGSRLLWEKRDNSSLLFNYDHTGLAGFLIGGGLKYFYMKNALGDIVGIYDMTGECVAEYSYDAWGNCAIVKSVDGIAELNPFRYRGYYYDSDIGLYYLINRYYDPATGRFLSDDHIGYILEQSQQVNGCNAYAYCLNNPVMGYDPEGTVVVADDAIIFVFALFFLIIILSQLPKPTMPGNIGRERNNSQNFTKPLIESKVPTPISPELPNITEMGKSKGKRPINPNRRKGADNRQPSGARERNVGHPNGEEHSRVPKGNRPLRFVKVTDSISLKYYAILATLIEGLFS